MATPLRPNRPPRPILLEGDRHEWENLIRLNVNEKNAPVDVVLPVCGEVVVDDERNLLDINAPGEQVGGDEDARRARPELPHDYVTLLLVHVAMLKISCDI